MSFGSRYDNLPPFVDNERFVGDNISPSRIEAKLDIEPEISQSMLYGDFKNYLVAKSKSLIYRCYSDASSYFFHFI